MAYLKKYFVLGLLILSIGNAFSQITNNVIGDDQTVCLNGVAFPFHGSQPSGGTNTYIYLWEASPDLSTWSPAPGQNDSIHYVSMLNLSGTNNIFLRRIVTSGTELDTSNIVTITILLTSPAIANNDIGSDQQVCPGQTPATLMDTGVPLTGGSGTYYFMWLKDDDPGFNSPVYADGIYDQADYSFPAAPDQTYWYARIVASNSTMDECPTPSNLVRIDVLSVTNNVIEDNQDICAGDDAAPIFGPYPETNYLNTFAFQWEESTDSINFNPISGANNFLYDPGQIFADTYYRRRVTAVLMNGCGNQDTVSNVVKVNVADPIDNNIVGPAGFPDYSICYGTNTYLGHLNPPTGGDGNYTYLWQDSIIGGTWLDAPGANNLYYYITPNLIQNTYYRRIVSSCGYSNTSDIVPITIDPLPTYYIDIEDTICIDDGAEMYFEFYGTYPWSLEMGDGTSTWTIGPEYNSPYIDYLTPTIQTTFVVIDVVDGNDCHAANAGSAHNVVVYDRPNVYAGLDTVICGLKTEQGLAAVLSDPSNTGEWHSAAPVYFENFTDPKSNINVDNYGDYMLEWTEYNDFCMNMTAVNVLFVEKLEDSVNYAGNNLYLTMQNEVQLNAYLPEGYTGLWQIYEGNGKFNNDYSPDAVVYDLEIGKNILTWEVFNEYCGVKTDTIVIDITDKLKIPDGFSPNGDGNNDFFVIRGLNIHGNSRLYIFNRWGNEVNYFESYNNDWDGKDFNGTDLPDDTYYYLLEFEQVNDVFKGFVVIKR